MPYFPGDAGGSGQSSPPKAPSSMGASGSAGSIPLSSQPMPAMSSLNSSGNGSMMLLNSQFMPGGNPGAYAASPPGDLGSGMQVGIANLMSSEGAGGFSEMSSMMMQNDHSAAMGSSGQKTFSQFHSESQNQRLQSRPLTGHSPNSLLCVLSQDSAPLEGVGIYVQRHSFRQQRRLCSPNASKCLLVPQPANHPVLLPSWEMNSFSFPEAIFSLSVPAALNWTCAAADRRYEVTVWMYIATANACANPTAHQHRSPPPCAKPSHIFFPFF